MKKNSQIHSICFLITRCSGSIPVRIRHTCPKSSNIPLCENLSGQVLIFIKFRFQIAHRSCSSTPAFLCSPQLKDGRNVPNKMEEMKAKKKQDRKKERKQNQIYKEKSSIANIFLFYSVHSVLSSFAVFSTHRTTLFTPHSENSKHPKQLILIFLEHYLPHHLPLSLLPYTLYSRMEAATVGPAHTGQ